MLSQFFDPTARGDDSNKTERFIYIFKKDSFLTLEVSNCLLDVNEIANVDLKILI